MLRMIKTIKTNNKSESLFTVHYYLMALLLFRLSKHA